MKPVGLQTLRSRWFAVFVHLCLWVVLYLAAAGIGGKTPEFHESDSFSAPAQSPAPVARLDQLFAPDVWPKWPGETNCTSAFYTRHFIPRLNLPQHRAIVDLNLASEEDTWRALAAAN